MDPVEITSPGFRNLCESNDNVIVFPLNLSDKKFSRTIYSPEMTNGRACTEEVNQTLTFFELAMSKAAAKSDFHKRFCRRFRYPFLILWVFWAFFMPRRNEPFWLCIAIYCIARICFFFKNKNAITPQDILDLVQPEYLKKGLRWHIPEKSYEWIELIKEYHEGEQPNATDVQVYPTLPENASMNYQNVVPEEKIMSIL